MLSRAYRCRRTAALGLALAGVLGVIQALEEEQVRELHDSVEGVG